MHVVLLTLLTAIAFGVPLLQNKNLQLKRANSLLLKAVKELTAEQDVAGTGFELAIIDRGNVCGKIGMAAATKEECNNYAESMNDVEFKVIEDKYFAAKYTSIPHGCYYKPYYKRVYWMEKGENFEFNIRYSGNWETNKKLIKMVCMYTQAAEGAVGGTYETILANRLQALINSKDYRSQGDGYCDGYRYLKDGKYPDLLTSGTTFNEDDRLRECMNRCLADAYRVDWGRFSQDLGGFYVRNSDKHCACASGTCSERSGASGEYHGYKIVDAQT